MYTLADMQRSHPFCSLRSSVSSYRKTPRWTTYPIAALNPSPNILSGILHTRKSLQNAASHASKTVWERSCCATTQKVALCLRLLSQSSLQVLTKGPISASLYMQSQATIISTVPAKSTAKSVSQSKARSSILLVESGTCFDSFCVPGWVALGFKPFSFRLCLRALKTYCWSVAIYLRIFGAMAIATTPAIPQPSSSTVDSSPTMPFWKKMFEGEETHSANLGVIFHRTTRNKNYLITKLFSNIHFSMEMMHI